MWFSIAIAFESGKVILFLLKYLKRKKFDFDDAESFEKKVFQLDNCILLNDKDFKI